MSWYNYKRWKDSIRKQRETNTPRIFISAITKFVASKSLLYHQTRGSSDDSRYKIILNALIWFVSHSELANVDIYDQVRKMAHVINEDDDYVRILEEHVCTCMPYWFANALVNKKTSVPRYELFENMSYQIDNDVLEEFGDHLPAVNISRLLESSHIENKDIFHKFFFTRRKDEIPDILSIMNSTNLRHIDLEFINEILSVYSYSSLKELLNEMSTPEYIFRCSISPIYVANAIGLWETIHFTTERILREVYRNPILSKEEFIEIINRLNYIPDDHMYQQLATYNPKTTLDMIRSGHMSEISSNVMIILSESSEITIEDVIEMVHLEWDWESLSHNENIATPVNIERYHNLPWVWGRWGISASESLTEEFIEKNFVLLNVSMHPYGEGSLLQNPCVTTNIIDSHPEVDWDYTHNGLSKNPNITLPYFINNLNRDWDLHAIAENIGICKDTAVIAIQSCWRIYKTHQKAKWLAEQVVEWSYHPDCKPAMNIRKRQFEENRSSLFI
jgi:hypothetical protein